MRWQPLVGLLAILYAVLVFWIAAKKPEKIWNMGKIQFFIKVMGEKGTVIFFFIFSGIAAAVGVWLFTL